MQPNDRYNDRDLRDVSFHTTQWSIVLGARGHNDAEVAQSLEALCRQYWTPLYAFLRSRGHREHDAQDLIQAFFAKLLEKGWLESVDPTRGRFRSFLLMALKRFIANEYDHRNALKRGGGITLMPLDKDNESIVADPNGRSLESSFDRQWAIAVLDAVVRRLQQDYADAGRLDDYESLKSCLTAERGTIDYESLAVKLGVRPVSARSSVHRLRARFRELFRDEVAATVADPAEVDDEMKSLFRALSAQ